MKARQHQKDDDPGRVKQIAAGQAPSGQTGVQTGRINGVPVGTPVPQY